MKTEMILKPVAFAIAVALSGSVMAGGGGHSGSSSSSGASATVNDVQDNQYNDVDNESTINGASVSGSLNGSSGNVGANVAAGDNNQQANAAAIATSDAFFVFGVGAGLEASASVNVKQYNANNEVSNEGTQNSASLVNSGRNVSGNTGINIAAGTSNQQKNDLAIASSETAFTASASVDMEQFSNNNYTDNAVGDLYELGEADEGASGLGETSGQTLSFFIPPWGGGGSDDDPQTPVVNNASMSNSLNGASGNVGVNIAAGSGNQQANSLAIARGCSACVPDL
ncbi:hypothetical protein [Halopseudomonas maritima]|uniref:hypothetical protein n=1 Tax=Halopseudomonas maritima TaxID=2918528 RepID=UPI001EECB768|nr:hypothetical protein [Halopseudomonas maritima]UJJ31973.1 hypothetical protein HV822_02045 [Halopseudomonas maritima]